MKQISFIVLFFLSCNVFAEIYSMEHIKKLKNDKEVKMTRFSKEESEQVLAKYNEQQVIQIGDIFYKVMYQFVNNSNLRCELNLVDRLRNELVKHNLSDTIYSIRDILILLRSTNYIDDILFEFFDEINKDFFALREIDNKKYVLKKDVIRSWTNARGNEHNRRAVRDFKKLIKINDTKNLYGSFKNWPNEKDSCVYQQISFLKMNLVDYKNAKQKINIKRKKEILQSLNRDVVINKGISLNTFMKLEYLREHSFINKRYLTLENYLRIVFDAKNQMKAQSYVYETQDISKEYNFSSKVLSRYNSLTRRKDLYEKYNSNQITMLALVLEKASMRMGTDPDVISSQPVIRQTFRKIKADGSYENYVEELILDPRSQFNLARKRLRKDLLDLGAMPEFAEVEIYYDEVVMAAFETGYLTIEDIEYAIKYDELWNPKETQYERILGYIFSFTGYATFFLPPPYNVTASIGLVIVENILYNSEVKGELNDNAATFID